MKIIPRKNRGRMYPVFSIFDDFANTFFEDDFTQAGKLMALDIIENDDNYQIKANLPGMSKDDVSISVKDSKLVIKAETSSEDEEKDGNYCARERYAGFYQRVIELSRNCDKDNIKANMKDGVLNLIIPKVEPEPKKEIAIE